MSKNITKKSWAQVSSKAKVRWAKITEDELKEIDGNYSKLIDKVQNTYGYEQERAQREVDLFLKENR